MTSPWHPVLTTVLSIMGICKEVIILILLRIMTTSQVVVTRGMEDEVEQEQKQEHNLELELHQEVDQKQNSLPLLKYLDF